MVYIDRGSQSGKSLLEGTGTAVSDYDRHEITQQLEYARRLATDQRFSDAVRLCARADSVLQGSETALECVVKRLPGLVTRVHEMELDHVTKRC